MSDTLLGDLILEEMNCCQCGVRFGLSQPLDQLRKRDFRIFYCPNGHGQSYIRPPKPRDEEMELLRLALRETKDALAAERAAHEQLAASRRPLFRKAPA